MTENSPQESESGFTPKEAAAPVFGMGDLEARKIQQQQQTKILWGIFGLLMLLVVGVLFLLPRFISSPDPANIAPVVIPVERPRPQQAFSPFEEAQMLREREEAQEVLAQILDLQEALEDIGVESWAEEKYAAALITASEGDSAYREQDFTGATEVYQTALLALNELESSSLEVFSNSISDGYAAILEKNAALAEASFRTALLINSESEEGQNGLNRALILPEVLNYLEQGDQAHDNGELEQALELYQQALTIDSANQTVAEAITKTRLDILNRDFLNYMSAGFNAIQADKPEQALNSFNQALSLKPESPEALSAISQAKDRISSRDLSIQLSLAQEYESVENWQDALTAFNKALDIDPNIVAAIQGQQRSEIRLKLDTYLKNILNEPLRLEEEAVYQESIAVYNQALELVNAATETTQNAAANSAAFTDVRNTRLYQQLLDLRTYLDKARMPLAVTLNSDGLTNVTVYRVSELGLFNSHILNLNPGNYIAVGVRAGYRDVRVEFSVPFNGPAPLVTVVCNERI